MGAKGLATMLQGDWLEVCRELPADHFHVCATSPPYFALRSYLPSDHPLKPQEIGSEPDPKSFIDCMVRCFREVRRVLHPSGTLWVNLGDSYSAAGWECHRRNKVGSGGMAPEDRKPSAVPDVGNGQLLNLPHRVAEALRADGWIWRQTIIWQKKSPMPESCKGWRWERCRVKVKGQKKGNSRPQRDGKDDGRGRNPDASRLPDGNAKYAPCPGCEKCSPHGGYVLRKGKGRCTTAHEYVFVFSKSPLYFWDSAAFVEEMSGKPHAPGNKAGRNDGHLRNDFGTERMGQTWGNGTRNPRSVWLLSSEPSSEKHFAAFPSELARRMIQAGSSDGGCCPQCGAPWAPMVESTAMEVRHSKRLAIRKATDETNDARTATSGTMTKAPSSSIVGYRPTCECNITAGGCPLARPCRVLDPFAGTGTTLQTAKWMGRDSVGVELNPEYVEIALRRLEEPPRWWTKRHREPKRVNHSPDQPTLF